MNQTMGVGKKLAVLLILLTFCTVTFVPVGMTEAAEQESSSESSEAGLAVAGGFLTLVYFPLKFVYASLGGIIGGFTYVLTGFDLETAQHVWKPSIYGTYVITPSNLKGEEPVRFFGISPYENESE